VDPAEEELAAAVASGVLSDERWFGGLSSGDSESPLSLLRAEGEIIARALHALGGGAHGGGAT
jgi:hypothetical protein